MRSRVKHSDITEEDISLILQMKDTHSKVAIAQRIGKGYKAVDRILNSKIAVVEETNPEIFNWKDFNNSII
jgi:hypothetical protein